MSKTTMIRGWAESVVSAPVGSREEAEVLAAEHILSTTTEPTMADVEWDDDKHRGAGATDANGRLWVMLQDEGVYIGCVGLDMEPCGALADELTPNGERYELVEVTDKPEHPEVLSTLEDYVGAPIGTVVAAKAGRVWSKDRWCDWETTNSSSSRLNRNMAGTERRVLRWGWVE